MILFIFSLLLAQTVDCFILRDSRDAKDSKLFFVDQSTNPGANKSSTLHIKNELVQLFYHNIIQPGVFLT